MEGKGIRGYRRGRRSCCPRYPIRRRVSGQRPAGARCSSTAGLACYVSQLRAQDYGARHAFYRFAPWLNLEGKGGPYPAPILCRFGGSNAEGSGKKVRAPAGELRIFKPMKNFPPPEVHIRLFLICLIIPNLPLPSSLCNLNPPLPFLPPRVDFTLRHTSSFCILIT